MNTFFTIADVLNIIAYISVGLGIISWIIQSKIESKTKVYKNRRTIRSFIIGFGFLTTGFLVKNALYEIFVMIFFWIHVFLFLLLVIFIIIFIVFNIEDIILDKKGVTVGNKIAKIVDNKNVFLLVVFLANGVNPNMRFAGATHEPLIIKIVRKNWIQGLIVLKFFNAKVDSADCNGNNALQIAGEKGNEKIQKLLKVWEGKK